MKVSRLLVAGALALGLFSTAAYAAGMFSTYPSSSTLSSGTTSGLTGLETIPADTNLANGQNPQTVIIPSAVFGLGTPGAVTAASGAATYNGVKVNVTSESLTTAAAADYTLTLTDNAIAANSFVDVSVANGTNTTEGIAVNRVQAAAGSTVIHIRNTNASVALNGTLVISVWIH